MAITMKSMPLFIEIHFDGARGKVGAGDALHDKAFGQGEGLFAEFEFCSLERKRGNDQRKGEERRMARARVREVVHGRMVCISEIAGKTNKRDF